MTFVLKITKVVEAVKLSLAQLPDRQLCLCGITEAGIRVCLEQAKDQGVLAEMICFLAVAIPTQHLEVDEMYKQLMDKIEAQQCPDCCPERGQS